MTGRAAGRQEGSTSVEFAIVASIMVIFMMGIFRIGILTWKTDALQEVASETARGVAIASTAATTATCADSTSAAKCYAEQLAKSRGVTLQASNVTVVTNASCGLTGSTAFTQVTIVQTYSLLSQSYTINLSACFPNNPT